MICRLCGAEADEFPIAGVKYAECRDCSYIGIEQGRLPEPAAEEARYRLHRNSFDDERYRAWIAEFLDRVAVFMPSGARVLDFGSGPEPVPARLLTERGYDVSVYDPFFAPGDSWRDRSWDVILVHEVAEHLAEPGRVFSELASLLEPRGALCVRTRFPPDSEEAFARWRYRMDATHVGFFRERSFGLLAGRLGLKATLVEAPDRVVLTRQG